MSDDFKMSAVDGHGRGHRWLWRMFARKRGGERVMTERGDHPSLGQWGEGLAVRHLERQGFRLVLTNFSAPIGQRRDGRLVTGEIDIIAYDAVQTAPVLVFIEVKTRSSDAVATPESAVNRRKQRQIARTARVYRRLLRVWDEPYRYDVLTVLARPGQRAEISLHRGYFDDRMFRGSVNWS